MTSNSIVNKYQIGGGKTRNSSFELLRLVAMLFIVTEHLLIFNARVCGYFEQYSIEKDGVLGIFLNSIAVIGVNLFVMISGWFGIKRVWSQMIRLIFDCSLYVALSTIIACLFYGHQIVLDDIKHIIDTSHYWFIWCYFFLVLISPVLEKAISGVNTRQMTYWIVLLTVANLGLGYVLGMTNYNGYNATNFVYLYFLARWLRMIQDNKWFRVFSRYGLLIWVGAAAVLALGYVVVTGIVPFEPSHGTRYFGYNNPLVLLETMAVVSWFSRLKLRSAAINIVATGALGIYLLHGDIVMAPYRGAFVKGLWNGFGYPGLFLAIVCVYGGCLLLSIAVEWMKGHVGIVRRVYAIGQYVEERIK